MSGIPFDPDALTTGLAPIAKKSLFSTWRLERDTNNPDKHKKVPYLHGGFRLAGMYSDPTLPSKLMTLADAIHAKELHGHDGVGIVFTPGCGVAGVDFDKCVVHGKFVGTPEQQEALAVFEPYSFIECSQSGKGLHAIALGDAVTNKMNGVLELFGNKNFLALTGLSGRGVATAISTDQIDRVNALICILKGAPQRKNFFTSDLNYDLTSHLKGVEGQESIEIVRSALRHLDPGMPREQWLTVIWAIRHGLGDTPEALELADTWSIGGIHA